MTSDLEERYESSVAAAERELGTGKKRRKSLSRISKTLMPVFDAIISIIHENRSALGDDADEFAEALCLETGFRILECSGMAYALLDLLLASRFIAGEAAVAYSMSGVVDVLDKEHQIRRIASAFLGGLTYLLMLEETEGQDYSQRPTETLQ
ncbi:MAG: hypothetical protein ACW99U_06660 [Candidatus Thorarchaeota archaeon]